MKNNTVKINESVIRKMVAESVKNVMMKEGLRDYANLIGNSKYYFENHKRWAKRASKILSSLRQLEQYLGNNGEDEDCRNAQQAVLLVQKIIQNLNSYAGTETSQEDKTIYL